MRYITCMKIFLLFEKGAFKLQTLAESLQLICTSYSFCQSVPWNFVDLWLFPFIRELPCMWQQEEAMCTQ